MGGAVLRPRRPQLLHCLTEHPTLDGDDVDVVARLARHAAPEDHVQHPEQADERVEGVVVAEAAFELAPRGPTTGRRRCASPR